MNTIASAQEFWDWFLQGYRYLFLVVPSAFISIVAFWKRVISPLIALYGKAVVWFAADEASKGRMESFFSQWMPSAGPSGFDRLRSIESGLELLQGAREVRDHLDEQPRFSADANGHIVSVNRAFCRIFNITEDVAVGWGWINLFSPNGDTRDVFRRNWTAAVESGVEFFSTIPTNPQFETKLGTVEVYAAPIRDRNDRIMRWDGIFRLACNECLTGSRY